MSPRHTIWSAGCVCKSASAASRPTQLPCTSEITAIRIVGSFYSDQVILEYSLPLAGTVKAEPLIQTLGGCIMGLGVQGYHICPTSAREFDHVGQQPHSDRLALVLGHDRDSH